MKISASRREKRRGKICEKCEKTGARLARKKRTIRRVIFFTHFFTCSAGGGGQTYVHVGLSAEPARLLAYMYAYVAVYIYTYKGQMT